MRNQTQTSNPSGASYNLRQILELEEIEAILEKIWDLHNKLSNAIHSISQSHFLNFVNALRKHHNNNNIINKKKQFNLENDAVEDIGRAGPGSFSSRTSESTMTTRPFRKPMGKIWRLACGCCEHGSVVGFADDFGLGCDLGFVCV